MKVITVTNLMVQQLAASLAVLRARQSVALRAASKVVMWDLMKVERLAE